MKTDIKDELKNLGYNQAQAEKVAVKTKNVTDQKVTKQVCAGQVLQQHKKIQLDCYVGLGTSLAAIFLPAMIGFMPTPFSLIPSMGAMGWFGYRLKQNKVSMQYLQQQYGLY